MFKLLLPVAALLVVSLSLCYIPVYVMMPLNVINNDGTVNDQSKIENWLRTLKGGNVDGIMMDVWWGIVQRNGPTSYDWSGYRTIFNMCKNIGLKVSAVMSFHQCGGNVGDDCNIPMPAWVRNVASSGNWDIFYTDRSGYRDQECLSLGVDNVPVFPGNQTAVQLYKNYFADFNRAFADMMGNTIIIVEIGMGPAGELRYPSYQLQQGRWNFPGVGEFQCYDRFMLQSLKASAASIGHPDWGFGGPGNAGTYKDQPPTNIPFYNTWGNDNWNTEYGRFFLGWYAQQLVNHADNVMAAAKSVFGNSGVTLSGKVAGIHWWFVTQSHAAELTAGYYNTVNRNGYNAIAQTLKKYDAELAFTCFEMKDEEQHDCGCGPQGLVSEVRSTAFSQGMKFSAENALPAYDDYHYNQIISQSYSDGKRLFGFTYLRLGDSLMQNDNFGRFKNFVGRMHSI